MKAAITDTISYGQARAIMEARDAHGVAKPFSVGFVTFNKTKDEGGDYEEHEFVVLIENSMPLASVSPKKNLKKAREFEKGYEPKNPNHWVNQTKNLVILARDRNETLVRTAIQKIHVRLILTINGKEIIW
jgi:hypothetical protein